MVKKSPANAGHRRDLGSIPEPGRFLGGGIGNPLQYPFLEKSMDRRVWWAIVHEVAKESDTTEIT